MNRSDCAEGEAAEGTRAASRNVDLEAGHAQPEEDEPADGAHDSEHGVANDDAQGDLFPKAGLVVDRCLAVDWRVALSPDAFEIVVHFFIYSVPARAGGPSRREFSHPPLRSQDSGDHAPARSALKSARERTVDRHRPGFQLLPY